MLDKDFEHTQPSGVTAVDSVKTPDLFRMATEEAHPKYWLEQFDAEEYERYVRMNGGQGARLIPMIEQLASGLNARGAKHTAKEVRAGGLLVSKALSKNEGEDPDLIKFIRVGNYLSYLDMELRDGLFVEMSPTGAALRTLSWTLSYLASDFSHPTAG